MQEHYRKLLTYSYNIVGSYEDAKDVVQDVMEKYLLLDKSKIRDESNFLIKSVVNHSINFKKRQDKKDTFGHWLPEPISFDQADANLIKQQTASYTMLVLLENLNPKQRAVFILKNGFDYSHQEIAELLGISQENARKLFSRASKSVKEIAFNTPEKTTIASDVIKKYQKILSQANIAALEDLLLEDIQLTTDGGKSTRVFKAVEMGVKSTAKLLNRVQEQFLYDKTFSFHHLNHQPAICFWQGTQLYNCQILQIDGHGKIQNIYSIVDADKLKKLAFLSHS